MGILIFKLSIDHINEILTHHKTWAEVGLGESGETYIVAEDKKARSINRLLIEDKQDYFDKMQESGMSAREIKAIQSKSSNIGLQTFATEGVNNAISGQSSFSGSGFYNTAWPFTAKCQTVSVGTLQSDQ